MLLSLLLFCFVLFVLYLFIICMRCCWCSFSFSVGLFVWKGVWSFCLFVCFVLFVCLFCLFDLFVYLSYFFVCRGCEAVGGGIDIKLT